MNNISNMRLLTVFLSLYLLGAFSAHAQEFTPCEVSQGSLQKLSNSWKVTGYSRVLLYDLNNPCQGGSIIIEDLPLVTSSLLVTDFSSDIQIFLDGSLVYSETADKRGAGFKSPFIYQFQGLKHNSTLEIRHSSILGKPRYIGSVYLGRNDDLRPYFARLSEVNLLSTYGYIGLSFALFLSAFFGWIINRQDSDFIWIAGQAFFPTISTVMYLFHLDDAYSEFYTISAIAPLLTAGIVFMFTVSRLDSDKIISRSAALISVIAFIALFDIIFVKNGSFLRVHILTTFILIISTDTALNTRNLWRDYPAVLFSVGIGLTSIGIVGDAFVIFGFVSYDYPVANPSVMAFNIIFFLMLSYNRNYLLNRIYEEKESQKNALKLQAERLGESLQSIAKMRADREVQAYQSALRKDLHDGLSGQLVNLTYASKLDLENSVIVEQIAENALMELRDILNGNVTNEYNMRELLRRLDARFIKSFQYTGIDFRVSLDQYDLDCYLPAHVSINLYRLLQEFISNCVWHGNAKAITISVVCSSSFIKLEIVSSGGKPYIVRSEGFGTKNLKERAKSIGLRFRVSSLSDGAHFIGFIDRVSIQ